MKITRKELLKDALPHDELIEKYIMCLSGSEHKKKTYSEILRRYGKYLKDRNIEKPLEENVIAFIEFIKCIKPGETHLTMAQKCKVVVRGLYKWAYELDYYPNIASTLKSEHIDNLFKRVPLEAPDARRLLAYAKGRAEKGGLIEKRDYAMLVTAVTMGLRTIEIANMEVQDFLSLSGKTYVYIRGKGKPDKTDRVLVPEATLAIINDYLKCRDDKSSFVFANHGHYSRHQNVDPKTVSKAMKHLFRCIGIDDAHVTAHSLRHTFATLARENGAPLDQISMCLRHKSISTTQIYEHAMTRDNNETEYLVSDIINKI